jgi:pimeloyl-ACP methyl ester carboxylesterase
MTVVLVHGNPETDAVWGPLVAELGRTDVVRLSPPGWGAPVPDGWGATIEEYRGWLVGELEAIGEPVDLVGHDWGGGHVANVATTRPDLLRTWCSDVLGVFEPDYVWHDIAQVWQTPGSRGARDGRPLRRHGRLAPPGCATRWGDARGTRGARALVDGAGPGPGCGGAHRVLGLRGDHEPAAQRRVEPPRRDSVLLAGTVPS